ncbi:unnamed protein product [Cyprideis torosa]|uniref:Uncharacterized protein n=1 Tax=Cyprideis torosa TaxID=163714 RepID=A0A7R8WHG0_9CRUS|nr:unnamed protein product [Cyprideis torosa]CAG0896595.1 unnamed protein product [Cyprideis torosa]
MLHMMLPRSPKKRCLALHSVTFTSSTSEDDLETPYRDRQTMTYGPVTKVTTSQTSSSSPLKLRLKGFPKMAPSITVQQKQAEAEGLVSTFARPPPLWSRIFGRKSTMDFRDVPHFLQTNQFIRTGYRPTMGPRSCLRRFERKGNMPYPERSVPIPALKPLLRGTVGIYWVKGPRQAASRAVCAPQVHQPPRALQELQHFSISDRNSSVYSHSHYSSGRFHPGTPIRRESTTGGSAVARETECSTIPAPGPGVPHEHDYGGNLLYMFSWNNETMNIWTHLLGVIWLALVLLYDLFYAKKLSNQSSHDMLVAILTIISFQICLTLSVVFHVFNCVSQAVCYTTFKWDVLGVALATFTFYWTGIYCGYQCFPFWRTFYWLSSFSVFVITVALHQWKEFLLDKYRSARIFLFVLWAAYGIVPTLHWIYLYGGIGHPWVKASTKNISSEQLGIPETRQPDKDKT